MFEKTDSQQTTITSLPVFLPSASFTILYISSQFLKFDKIVFHKLICLTGEKLLQETIFEWFQTSECNRKRDGCVVLILKMLSVSSKMTNINHFTERNKL